MGQKNRAMCDYLEKPDKFADFINGSLYQGKEVIRAGQIEESQTVYSRTGRERDVLKKICNGESYLLIGIENQNRVHYAMPLRCMEYDALEYRRQLRKLNLKYRRMQKEQNTELSGPEFLSGMKKEDRLSPVITIVFYHGTEEYDGCRTLHDMLDFVEENGIFRRYVSDYHMNLITLDELKEENFQTGVRELVGFLKRSRNKTELQKYCTENAERIHRLDEDTFDTISVMIDQPDFVKWKESYRKGERIDMCQAMADWKKDILREGVKQGIDRGIKQGINRGLEQGIEALILDNLEEGVPEIRIIEKLQKRFALEEESARSYFMKYAVVDMD